MKLVMMKGLPASGKSTKAKEIIEEGGNFVRLNRDLLRTMLHFDKWNGKNEGTTMQVEDHLAGYLLSNGYNVIVDDCNLSDRHLLHWSSIAINAGAKFESIAMNVDPDECLIRDAKREKRVGRHVINRMAMEHQLDEFPNGIIICDIDGTIADITHRTPILYGGETDRSKYKDFKGKKNWKDFFASMSEDRLRKDVADKLIALADETGAPIVFVSARGSEYEELTTDWLDWTFPSPYYTVLMRKAGDRRVDELVKREIYDRYLSHYKIIKVFDDRPRVVRMWRELGLDVEDCGDGVEF